MITEIYGHRGSAATHPENTLVSFAKAASAGAEGIEMDVHLSSDGAVVVMHDECLERTSNGKGLVKNYTLTQLKTLDVGSWFSQEFAGQRIPTLEEVLQHNRDWNMKLNIELKNGVEPYPQLEEKVVQLIEKYKTIDQVVLSSFNHYSLVKLKQINPEIETAVLLMEKLYKPWDYAHTVGANSIHCYHPAVDKTMVSKAQNAHIHVRAFTVNEDHHIQSLIQWQCSGIITDNPEKAINIRKNTGEKLDCLSWEGE